MVCKAHSLALLLALAAPAFAAEEAELDALTLADAAPADAKPEPASALRAFAEASLGQVKLQGDPGATQNTQRLSLDLFWDKRLSPELRAVFSDRLDLNHHSGAADASKDTINTLKEAFLSWQPRSDAVLDLGRINARFGVAQGYNPTDFLREHANRSFVSVDPNSIRENRLGTVMLRGQTLWNGGSLTALIAPKLADAPNDAAWSPDLGATNNRNRWLLAASHKLSEQFNPQVLLFGDSRQPAQVGLNLATPLSDAAVAHLEWSGGRTQTLTEQSLAGAGERSFRQKLATGLTYTSTSKVSVTAELEYNGAALRQADWNALRSGSPLVYGLYRAQVQDQQELTTHRAAYLRAAWQDAFVQKFDLTAMLQVNLDDHSRLSWLEARYHWDRVELALQWQLNTGNPSSDYGAWAERRNVQALMRVFF